MARVLNFFNRSANTRVAEVLDIQPGQQILEVGFGGGAAVGRTVERLAPSGALCAVDLSRDMAFQAQRTFARFVAAHQVFFVCADVVALPLASSSFDHAYAIHSHLYWPNPLGSIREFRRVVRPGGKLLLAMDMGLGLSLIKLFGHNYQPPEPPVVIDLMHEAGYDEVVTQTLSGNVVAVVGHSS